VKGGGGEEGERERECAREVRLDYSLGYSAFGNRTQNSRVAGASPTTSPSGDLIPTIKGSGAHPGCGEGETLTVWETLTVCVFITAGPSSKLFAWGGGGYWGTCATRDDEPRPVWTSLLPCCVCVFITAGPSTKLFTLGGGDMERQRRSRLRDY
jgi:hypothetical protein